MAGLFALVDCNNFYVSCERVFQPELRGKPAFASPYLLRQHRAST